MAGIISGYIASGEWVEYTIDVAEAGIYTVTTEVASLDGNGRFRYVSGTNRSRAQLVPSTNSWMDTVPVSTTLNLDAGEHILRLEMLQARPFNVDRFTFELLSGVATEDETPPALRLTSSPIPPPMSSPCKPNSRAWSNRLRYSMCWAGMCVRYRWPAHRNTPYGWPTSRRAST